MSGGASSSQGPCVVAIECNHVWHYSAAVLRVGSSGWALRVLEPGCARWSADWTGAHRRLICRTILAEGQWITVESGWLCANNVQGQRAGNYYLATISEFILEVMHGQIWKCFRLVIEWHMCFLQDARPIPMCYFQIMQMLHIFRQWFELSNIAEIFSSQKLDSLFSLNYKLSLMVLTMLHSILI